MIEKMKTLSLVCLQQDREATLQALRDLEIVQVKPGDFAASETLAEVQRRGENVQRLLNLLAGVTRAKAETGLFNGLEGEALFERVQELSTQTTRCSDEQDTLAREEEQLAPWGDFDQQDLAALKAKGLDVRLCMTLGGRLPELPAHAALQEVRREKDQVWYLVLSSQPLELPLPEVVLPQGKTLEGVRLARAEGRKRLDLLQAQLAEAALVVDRLTDHRLGLSEREEFLTNLEGMGAAGELAWLQGYCPAKAVDALKLAALSRGWALLLEDPAEDDGGVPTLITVPKWLQLSKPLFDFIGIAPGYREFDISAWFLIFFAIFFSIIVGDAGYGTIMTGLVLWFRRKAEGKARVAYNLMLLLSVCTIGWGFITGNYFGTPRETWPTLMQGIPWFWEDRNIQYLCFGIGAVHLTIAHAIKVSSIINSRVALAELGWTVIIWGNFFLGSSLVTNRPMPSWIAWQYGVGMVLVALFTSGARNPLKVFGLGLGALAGGLVNSFVDVLSYIRLFAVGMSGYYMAKSFNDMCYNMFSGAEGIAWVALFLLAAVIIVMGHMLNLALSGLGVLVHGIRLNTLEFSGHVGLEWAGTPFRAFARRLKPGQPN